MESVLLWSMAKMRRGEGRTRSRSPPPHPRSRHRSRACKVSILTRSGKSIPTSRPNGRNIYPRPLCPRSSCGAPWLRPTLHWSLGCHRNGSRTTLTPVLDRIHLPRHQLPSLLSAHNEPRPRTSHGISTNVFSTSPVSVAHQLSTRSTSSPNILNASFYRGG